MPRGITTKTVIKKIFDIPGIIHLYINSWLVMLEKRSDAIFRYSNGREISFLFKRWRRIVEPFVIATLVAGVLVSGIVAEIIALPLGDRMISQTYVNSFWDLESSRGSGNNLLEYVNNILPEVDVLQELCSVRFPL